MKRWTLFALLVAGLIVAILATGWHTVDPGEVVVVRRFGRVLNGSWKPGFHFGWPLGVDRLSRLRLDEVRQLDFGRIDPAGPLDEPGSGEFLTGDRNILRLSGIVQFRVADPVAFVLQTEDFKAVLTRVTDASLARSVAARPIDSALREGRSELAREVSVSLVNSVERLGLGIEILGVNLTDARPPVEVEPAFAEAQSALSDRDRQIHEARSLAGKLRPIARSSAENRLDLARSESFRKSALARSEADRFVRLLAEASRSRALTVQTLYRDALRDLLPKIQRKILLTPEEPVDLGVIGR